MKPALFVAAVAGLTTSNLALVTGAACLFGMLSSSSRAAGSSAGSAARQLALNLGAVWIAAFAIAATTGAGMATAAMIGLGVGLAGSKVLEVIEAGAVTLARRVSGRDDAVTRGEVEEMLGDLRNDTQATVSEVRVRQRKMHKRIEGEDE